MYFYKKKSKGFLQILISTHKYLSDVTWGCGLWYNLQGASAPFAEMVAET
jgi:hypothetical protein